MKEERGMAQMIARSTLKSQSTKKMSRQGQLLAAEGRLAAV
jgi:hypothetical protein